ncbi:hypothetical protein DFH07DRAFT_974568 [Mycena maculata]|uniref:Uncharacterized protein n=1 Tax=Mycena maculata TaxID=230809 RepID=A0AAD7H7P3_9AGAR|nr:hypothetical protein DFH07DRAFT_974568 [Mycena maculata]
MPVPPPFTLNPDPNTHPSPPPCVRYRAPLAPPHAADVAHAGPSSAAADGADAGPSSAASAAPRAGPGLGTPLASSVASGSRSRPIIYSPTPSPGLSPSPPHTLFPTESCYGGYGGITPALCVGAPRSPLRTLNLAPSPFNKPTVKKESVSPKKEEPLTPTLPIYTVPRVSPTTRVQLSPSGHARARHLHLAAGAVAASGHAHAEALNANAAAQIACASPSPLTSSASASASPEPSTPANRNATVVVTPATPTTPARGSITNHSVLVTPRPQIVHAAPAPSPPPPPPAARLYGIHGVAVFYTSIGQARAAAARLGIPDSSIMVTDNLAKLEAWMTGAPFFGEDG